MRIAVVSKLQQEGKTAVMCLFAGLYAATQQRKAVMLSANDAVTTTEYNKAMIMQDAMSSTAVLTALAETGGAKDTDILTYATRIGKGNLFTYKTVDKRIQREDSEKLILSLMSKEGFDLTVIEVKDTENSTSRRILDNVDAIIYVFTPSVKSLNAVEEYLSDTRHDYALRTCFVCNKYDEFAATNKKLAERIGMSWKDIVMFPYNSFVAKSTLDGNLYKLVDKIIKGDESVIALRKPIVDLMQFFYNDSRHKVIKGVEQWNK